MTLSVTELTTQLWPLGDGLRLPQVHLLLDGARDPAISSQIRFGKLQYECLFGEPLSPRLRAAAPYLVHLSAGSPQTCALLERVSHDPCGVFLTAPPTVSTVQLRRHLKKLLWVRVANAQLRYFRYYDPRVLSAYLPTCTEREWLRFMGPIDHLHFLEGGQLRRFSIQGRRGEAQGTAEVRTVQLDVLHAAAREALLHQLAQQLKSYAPPPATPMPEQHWVGTVRALAARARAYGLERYCDVFLFAVFALQSGWEVDGALEFHWARNLLTDDRNGAPPVRLGRLLDEAMYRREVERSNRHLWDLLTG